jgi:hypothetical protein
MSLNKPRPDYPIYPSTGYYRKRAEVFKRPKGRRGKKPKGQRVGNFVPFQDPNFLIIKAQDEARKARELALAESQQAAADREERQLIARQQLQLAQGSAQLQAAQAIEATEARRQEALFRRDDARAREAEARAREAQAEQLRLESDRREQRLIDDRREITGHLTRLYEAQERRAGENLELFKTAFQSIADRRPVDFRDIKAQEQTDLKLSPDERRDRRSRSQSRDEAVSAGFESLAKTPKGRRQRTPSPERERQVKQVLATQPKPQPEPETGGGATNVPIETIEQTTKSGRDVKKPKRFEGGATTPELAAAGGIEGQTPTKTPTPRGGSGSEEVERQRPKLKPGEVRPGKQQKFPGQFGAAQAEKSLKLAAGKPPVAKAVQQTPKTQQGSIGTDLFTSPAGKEFAEEVKKSEEALRKAAERAKPKLELKLSSEEEIAEQLGQTKKKRGGL